MIIVTKELRNEIEKANDEIYKAQEKMGFKNSGNIVHIGFKSRLDFEIEDEVTDEITINWSCIGASSKETTMNFMKLLELANKYIEEITRKLGE